MEFKITAKHMEVTPAIREYAEKKIQRLLRHYDRVQAVNIVIDQTDPRSFVVEMIIDIEHHDPIVASNAHTDLYASIDLTVDKADRQLTDLKEKIRNRKHPA